MLSSLLTILILAPLAYGTVGMWARLSIQGAVFALLLCWAIAALRGRRKVYRVPGGWPLLALCGLMLLQLVPLPPGVLQLLAPTAAGHYAEGVWLLAPGSWQPLSVNLRATLLESFQLCSGLAVLFLTIQLIDSRKALQRSLLTLLVFAGLYALISILYKLFPNDKILWVLHPWPERAGSPFGTYVNGNHFAGLMGMLLPLCLAWFLAHKPTINYSNWRERIVDFFNDPQSSPHLIYGMISLLVAVSIFLSTSRGGILSCLGGLVIFGLLLASRGVDRKRGLLLISFFGLLLFGVGIFGWEPIFKDFQHLRGADGTITEQRPEYWQDSFALVADYPVFGTGFGTYRDAYRGYQGAMTGELVVDHAHNDYVELVADGGLLGTALVAWLALSLLLAAVRGLKLRRTLLSNYLVLGALAGLGSIALHSLTDFNLHIGANLLWFGFLWGLLIAAAYTRSRQGRTTSDLPSGSKRLQLPLLIAAALILGGFLLFQGGACLALKTFAPAEEVDLRQMRDPLQLQELLALSETAAGQDPLQADYRFAVGNLQLALGQGELTLDAYRQALQRRPLDGELLQHAGLLLAGQGELKTADRLLQSAVALDRPAAEPRRVYGLWLLGQGRQEDGIRSLRQALELEPTRARQYLTLSILSGLDDRELAEVLPELSAPWLAYGDYLVSRNAEIAAEQSYRQALEFAVNEPRAAGSFRHVAAYYGKQKRWDEALQILTQALDVFPADASLHRMAGQYSERAGLTYQAKEFYRQTLLLNPRDKWVRKQLEGLR